MRNTGNLKSSKQLSGGSLGGGGKIAPRSKKMQKFYEEERIPFVQDFLARHPWCAFRLWLHPTTLEESPRFDSRIGRYVTRCTKRAVDVHEIWTRGRGGNIVPIEGQDEDEQFLGLCREHHGWITTHSKESKKLGYTK